MAKGRKTEPPVLPQQDVVKIPLSQLRLWTENPRDPLDGNMTNEQVIVHALKSDGEGRWSLRKLARQMGDHYDTSELPTVVRIKGGKDPQYQVYDGNRRVILALLQQDGFPEDGGAQFELPLVPAQLPCNVCDQATALEHVLRKHSNSGTWGTYERDLFMYRYMGADRSVLVRLQELTGAVTRWPELNKRYVKEDVLNDKHLQEMGLNPEYEDYGVSTEMLDELLEAVAAALHEGKIDTRHKRNDPVSVLPRDLLDRIHEDRKNHPQGRKVEHAQKVGVKTNESPAVVEEPSQPQGEHTKAQEVGLFPEQEREVTMDGEGISKQRRTRQAGPKTFAIFGGVLSLKPGAVNNIYRTLEELWELNERGKLRNSKSFVAVFRMGLRLLAETATADGMGEDSGLHEYVNNYAKEAKARLRQRADGQDIVTYLDSQAVNPTNMTRRLQSGAHGYSSTNNRDQAIAISILLGQMLILSHGRE
ncbi:MAG: hypothetical protein U0N15_00820 [Bifidobacterium choerinum]